jgi:propionyl-CoA carboxylase beta chain
MHSTQDKYLLFEKKNQQAEESGGIDRIEKFRSTGRLTARERINLFFDAGSHSTN